MARTSSRAALAMPKTIASHGGMPEKAAPMAYKVQGEKCGWLAIAKTGSHRSGTIFTRKCSNPRKL
jgi:hypothetical protein